MRLPVCPFYGKLLSLSSAPVETASFTTRRTFRGFIAAKSWRRGANEFDCLFFAFSFFGGWMRTSLPVIELMVIGKSQTCLIDAS